MDEIIDRSELAWVFSDVFPNAASIERMKTIIEATIHDNLELLRTIQYIERLHKKKQALKN
jgi:hypothetical protein